MTFAKIITESNGRGINITFCIMLKGILVQPLELRANPKDFAASLLGRQLDFIHSLHGLPIDYTIDLRYLFTPEQPDLIRIYFIFRINDISGEESAKWEKYFLNRLQVENNLHRFEPVTDENELKYLIEPFEVRHIAEIVRREDRIHLDTARKIATRSLGFMHDKHGEPETCSDDEIYHIFPYSLHLGNMERLCNTLLLQSYPCLISICMKPYYLTRYDEKLFEERIHTCEKYAQLQLSYSSNVDKLNPFLKMQAETLYKYCVKDLTQLQDASFFQKVQIVSPHPVPYEVVTVFGSMLTEQTGDPTGFSQNFDDSFRGGYDWYSPEDEDKFHIALSNFKNMEFANWIPSAATKEIRHWRYLFDIWQSGAGFRLPYPLASEFPGIDTIQYVPKPAPSNLPQEQDGLLLGRHVYLNRERNIYYKTKDRLRHTYVVGQTGTGKSTLFYNMILQDINKGRGVGVIDPHGELIDEVLCSVPDSRKKDVILINPVDYDFPVGINMLEYNTEFEKDFCVNYLMEVFDSLYDLSQTGGPMFEMYMRNSLQLLLDQPEDFQATVLDVPKMFQYGSFRKDLLESCTNPYVVSFWEEEAEKARGEAELRNIVPYITSKLSRFIYNNTIRCIVGQRHSTLSFDDIMNKKKILLVDLKKGMLGETNSHFLGMIIVGKILTAALARKNRVKKKKLNNFFLYVDEFQNLATGSFVTILSEARKYGLALTITNQYISQLKKYIINGILGNVGTLIAFRVGSDDGELLSKEFGAVVSHNDLIGLPNWHAYIRLLNSGKTSSPFDMQTIKPSITPRPQVGKEIRKLSRKKYGRERDKVENEIRSCW